MASRTVSAPAVARQVEMDGLAPGMDAGIGAPGGKAVDGLAAEAMNGLFQRLLHRWAVVLPLPPDEGPTVIFERQLEAGHGGVSPGDGRTAPRGTR